MPSFTIMDELEITPGGPQYRAGTGSPEGTVTAPVGSVYTDTTAGITYNKMVGTGNTGWSPVISAAVVSANYVEDSLVLTMMGAI